MDWPRNAPSPKCAEMRRLGGAALADARAQVRWGRIPGLRSRYSLRHGAILCESPCGLQAFVNRPLRSWLQDSVALLGLFPSLTFRAADLPAHWNILDWNRRLRYGLRT